MVKYRFYEPFSLPQIEEILSIDESADNGITYMVCVHVHVYFVIVL